MPSLTGCTIQVLAPQDTPNQGRTKINENFNCFLQVAFSGAAVNQFLSLVSGGLVSGNTDFVSGGQLLSGGTDLYNIFLTQDGLLRVQPGTNLFTGGTALSPSINLTGLSVDNITVSGNSRFVSLSGTSLSGGTLYSGTSELYSVLSPLWTKVQSGTNTFTAGTADAPTVNVTGVSLDNITVSGDARFISLSGTSLSGGTLYSGTSELYSVLSPLFVTAGAGDKTRVQLGTNTFTAGTDNFPSVNVTGASLDNITVSGDARFISLSGTSLSGGTLYSGTSELYSVLSPLWTKVQPGTNTFTAGTADAPTINVTGVSLDNITVSGDVRFISLSGTSLSGGTLYSGTSELYSVLAPFFEGGGDTTRVQPGTNTFTAGTANFPSINITGVSLDNLSVSGSVSACTISASNIDECTSSGVSINRRLLVRNEILDLSGFGLGNWDTFGVILEAPGDNPVMSGSSAQGAPHSMILNSSGGYIQGGAMNSIINSHNVRNPAVGGAPGTLSITGSSVTNGLGTIIGSAKSNIFDQTAGFIAASTSSVLKGSGGFYNGIYNSQACSATTCTYSFLSTSISAVTSNSTGVAFFGSVSAITSSLSQAFIGSSRDVIAHSSSYCSLIGVQSSEVSGGTATSLIGSRDVTVSAESISNLIAFVSVIGSDSGAVSHFSGSPSGVRPDVVGVYSSSDFEIIGGAQRSAIMASNNVNMYAFQTGITVNSFQNIIAASADSSMSAESGSIGHTSIIGSQNSTITSFITASTTSASIIASNSANIESYASSSNVILGSSNSRISGDSVQSSIISSSNSKIAFDGTDSGTFTSQSGLLYSDYSDLSGGTQQASIISSRYSWIRGEADSTSGNTGVVTNSSIVASLDSYIKSSFSATSSNDFIAASSTSYMSGNCYQNSIIASQASSIGTNTVNQINTSIIFASSGSSIPIGGSTTALIGTEGSSVSGVGNNVVLLGAKNFIANTHTLTKIENISVTDNLQVNDKYYHLNDSLASMQDIGTQKGFGDFIPIGIRTGLTYGHIHYFSGVSWTQTSSTDGSGGASKLLAIATESLLGEGGDTAAMLTKGYCVIPSDGVFESIATTVAGDILYMALIPGQMTVTQPLAPNNIIRAIGYILSTSTATDELLIKFDPDKTWATVQ